VTESRGNEEYVHLKSLEDEYEYMESNMPQKQPPPEEEEPRQSPNPAESGEGEGYVAEEPNEGLGSPLGLNPDHWVNGAPSSGSGNGKRGYSGEDDHEDLSPPLSSSSHAKGGGGGQRGNLWSSFGDGSDWIPPSKGSGADDTDAGEEEEDRRRPLPAGKRRPDLFASSSPYPPPPKDHFPLGREEEGEKKSNQFDDDEEGAAEGDPKTGNWGRAAYEAGDDSPFQYYGKKTPPTSSRGSRGEMKQWGSEDDID
jgi:hypothetical protein